MREKTVFCPCADREIAVHVGVESRCSCGRAYVVNSCPGCGVLRLRGSKCQASCPVLKAALDAAGRGPA